MRRLARAHERLSAVFIAPVTWVLGVQVSHRLAQLPCTQAARREAACSKVGKSAVCYGVSIFTACATLVWVGCGLLATKCSISLVLNAAAADAPGSPSSRSQTWGRSRADSVPARLLMLREARLEQARSWPWSRAPRRQRQCMPQLQQQEHVKRRVARQPMPALSG